ncbi:MAG: DUF507 domain-containing protein [Gammaproteobacteria bacterium]|nr:MAG: DUF507 domain-containing protein [Gammaproteobacteria bacterium]
MKIHPKILDKAINRLVEELVETNIVEVEKDKFVLKVREIFVKAQEEEKQLTEDAKKVLKENIHLLDETGLDSAKAVALIRRKLAEERNINLNPFERMNQIAKRIMDWIMEDDEIEIYDEPYNIRKRISAILKDAVGEQKTIEREAQRRAELEAQKRGILIGSDDWNFIYRKYLSEVMKEKGYE